MKAFIAVAAIAAFVLAVRPAFAGEDVCKNLSSVKASELLAFPELNPIYEFPAVYNFPPPGVTCTSEGRNAANDPCHQKATIGQDRMLGGIRRLVVAKFLNPGKKAVDGIFIFGCVDGKIANVFNQPYESGEKIKYAGADKIIVKGTDTIIHQSREDAFYWNEDSENYANEPSFGPAGRASPDSFPAAIKCSDLQTANKNAVMTLADSRFARGPGCYTEGFEDQSRCDNRVTIAEDRNVAPGRRLMVIDVVHVSGRAVVWEGVYVIGCVAGRVAKVFEDLFQYEATIDAVSADKLVLWARDFTKPDPESNPSGEYFIRLTYLWDSTLQNYILNAVYFSKIGPEEDYLPKKKRPANVPKPSLPAPLSPSVH